MALINKSVFVPYFPLLKQLTRFGVVGCGAASLHFFILVFLVEFGFLTPLYANVIAFFFAFQISYWGHRFWTFSGTTAQHKKALPKLLLIGGMGFFVNQSLFYILYTIAHFPYTVAQLLILTVVPIITFVISKLWVFK